MRKSAAFVLALLLGLVLTACGTGYYDDPYYTHHHTTVHHTTVHHHYHHYTPRRGRR